MAREYNGYAADRCSHEAPDPIRVAQITASHGADAAAARWYWVPASTLSHIAYEGRRLLNARAEVIARTRRRPTSPEQEVAIAAEVLAGGSLYRTAQRHGIPDSLVRAILQERGHSDWPGMRRGEVALQAGKR